MHHIYPVYQVNFCHNSFINGPYGLKGCSEYTELEFMLNLKYLTFFKYACKTNCQWTHVLQSGNAHKETGIHYANIS